MSTFTQTILYTDEHGYARFREQEIALSECTPASRLSAWIQAEGLQLQLAKLHDCLSVEVQPCP